MPSRCKPAALLTSTRRQRWQFEKFAHPRIHDFTVASHHGFANDFILQVVLQLAVLHLVDKEISDVTGIHLARMVRDAAGQIDGANDRDAVFFNSFAGAREFAVSSALGSKINDD